MAGRIPQDFIDSLIARSDIVEIIDDRVPLKKAGREYEACCPFHGEKTASFKVSPSKQFYHCFGCGAHGTALGFLMEYERLDFREAIELLAERCGMTVPDTGGPSDGAPDLRPIYELLDHAASWYRRQLREHSGAKAAVDYLKGRGLTGEIARDYGLGFAPPGWDNLLKHLDPEGNKIRLLESAGLVVERTGGGCYDRFRDRIMFPIHDRRGRTIGFGGRVLGDDTPKYLNSPETPVFHKGRELYGRWQAAGRGGRLDRLIVVEGYMDVVALAQHGITNAVATLGTAATPEHLDALFRLTPSIVFCFDGDAAGRRAAWRALENALPQMRDGRMASFMFLPDGEDPDSLVREQGATAFVDRAGQAASLSETLFEHLGEDLDLGTIEGQSRLHELGRPLLERLPQGAFKTLAYNRLAELSGVSLPAPGSGSRQSGPGSSTLNERRGAGGGLRRGTRIAGSQAETTSGSLVRRAILLLLNQPSAATTVGELNELALVNRPGIDLLVELIELLRANPHLTSGAVVERYRDHATGRHLSSLMAQPLALDAGLEQEFQDCIARLLAGEEKARGSARLRELAAKGLEALTESEKEELAELSRVVPGGPQSRHRENG